MTEMGDSGVEFYKVQRGDDVIVRGRRVPLLEAHHHDGGGTLLVFDRRIGLEVPVALLDSVTSFVADVMEQSLNYTPKFPKVHTIDSVSTEQAELDEMNNDRPEGY